MILKQTIFFPIFLLINSIKTENGFPGVIQLVGFNRNARMHQPQEAVSFVTPAIAKKYQADIETVKQNIEEYNKLLKIDTKKLSDHQKDMIERIVERVARLKESIEIESTTKNQNNVSNFVKSQSQEETITTTNIPPTQDGTIFSTNIEVEMESTTQQLHQQYEGRSNTIQQQSNRGTTSTQKSKTYRTSTKKPPSLGSTKPSTKRYSTSNHHFVRPSVVPYSTSSTTGTTFVANDQTIVPATTIVTTLQPQQLIVHDSTTSRTEEELKVSENSESIEDKASNEAVDDNVSLETEAQSSEQQKKPNIIIQQRTPAGTGTGYIQSDLVYDTNATTSTLIDSLSNYAREEYYNTNSNNNNKVPNLDIQKDKKPSSGTAKPTKYHYYPHNQHIYLLPECAIQQVCNAVYVRLNYTQPLCACPSRYRDPCSASLNEDDQHTTKLVGDSKKKAITLAKTCEATTEMRECRSPKDWSLLALQNTRTGKSHYLVICRCPDHFKLEGPMAHDQPTYASVPGIRVFGMMCVKPGYSIRKPSVQPPKRYQLQKPYYISQNKYGINKDPRPSITSSNGYQPQSQLHDSYQLQHQANYQYLNRPESSSIVSSSSNTDYADPVTFGSNGVYGRNNEKKGEQEINADNDEQKDPKIESIRVKRSIIENTDETLDFPLDKLIEFQQNVVWDN